MAAEASKTVASKTVALMTVASKTVALEPVSSERPVASWQRVLQRPWPIPWQARVWTKKLSWSNLNFCLAEVWAHAH